VEVAHENDKLISAALFPYPELARFICCQSWDDWNLDAFFPMVYQSIYHEDMEWVKSSTQKGVNGLNGKAPIITCFFGLKIWNVFY
jgi:hypothetical protein